MSEALWVDKHKPTLSELPHEDIGEFFEDVVGVKLNLLVHGPRGVGKTAAVRALGDASHKYPDSDFIVVNASDFFNRSKKEIRNDTRFGHFLRGQTEFSKQYRSGSGKSKKYKRNWSKRDMLCHVLKELAGYESTGGEYKTIVIDNAESMREDFQQALRRIMEKNHKTTQFIIISRSSSGIIPALQSRCTSVQIPSPSTEQVFNVIQRIADREGVTYSEKGLRFVAGYGDNDLRRAITGLQTVASKTEEVTPETAAGVLTGIGVQEHIDEALTAAENSELKDARKAIDSLLVDEGLDGEEVLGKLIEQVQTRYDTAACLELVEKAGGVNMQLRNGSNDRVHLTNFLTEVESTV